MAHHGTVTRRRTVHPIVGMGLAGIVGLASCTGAGAGGEQDAAVESLRIAVDEDVGPLNLFAGAPDPLVGMVYDTLLAPSPFVEEPQPWLAESVDQLDAQTWEVTVRDDVTWHDGEPLSAGDVSFTFDYMTEAPTGRYTHHVEEVPEFTTEQLDETTVRFDCAYPCPELGPVTLADLPIVPEHVWADIPGEQAEAHDELPVGSGPYQLIGYDSSSGYQFQAHEQYFAATPRVDELVMPIIEEPSATFNALRAGELDAAARPVPPELLEPFEQQPDMAVATTQPLQFDELRMNFQREPFDDHDFRSAVTLAVDRDELLSAVLLGEGRPADRGYPHPDSPWTNPDLSTPHEPDRAAELLDEQGYELAADGVRTTPDGTPLQFELLATGSEPTHVRAAEILAEQLGELGIEIDVATRDAGTIGDLFSSREFDMYINTIGPHGVADPTQLMMSHRSGYLWDAPEIDYPAFDDTFEAWAAEEDLDARRQIAFDFQETMNEQPTAVPLYYPDEHWAFRAEAYDGFMESPGYGIVHKWSFLPPEVADEVNAVTETFPGDSG